MDSMIRTRDLRVDYEDVAAVRDLNLDIHRGEIFGLIGPNGAGKSSTIRVLATLQQPTYGEVRIGGVDVIDDPRSVHRLLGYMPDMPPVYGDLRCWEYLDLFAAAYFIDRRHRRMRVGECLKLAGLEAKRMAMAGTLSRGMKQRLTFAKTLLADPQVLLLDEPASWLDPIARIEMREVIKELAERGRTILISSHILVELSEFCHSVGIMEKGVMVEGGRIDEIAGRLRQTRRLLITFAFSAESTTPANPYDSADRSIGYTGSADAEAGSERDVTASASSNGSTAGSPGAPGESEKSPPATPPGRAARALLPAYGKTQSLLQQHASVESVRINKDGHTFEVIFHGERDSDVVAFLAELIQVHHLPVKSFHEPRVGIEDILLKVGARETA